ncbi:MAG: inositol 2-dehydrogenase [Acidobacteria bacterium]|nr:inositol 2-dehydrogenase [Acidobacteriota bacterium]
MKRKLNVGVIGLGRLGNLYARYFTGRIANATLRAVSEIREDVAESFAREHDIPHWHHHYQDLLGDKEIDAVVIATPTSTHKDIVTEAARAGKAIFCEKPLTLSISDALVMQQVVEQTGVFFHLGFMRRFDHAYVAAKRKFDDGVIGDPVLFKSTSRDPYPPSQEYLDPEHSGGLITDCGIHDIDLARWFIGEVRSVFSIGGVLVYPEIESLGDVDNAVTTLKFENGILGVIDMSRSGIYGYDIHTEILGNKGTLQIGYLRETALRVLTKDNVSHDTVPYFPERFGQSYVTQLQNFVDRFLQDKPPLITCADGLAALRITLAATQSLKENRPISV